MTERLRDETRQEAKILSVLKHPSIVNFREVFTTVSNKLCIVMDYADGGDLHTAIINSKGKFFSESQILDWFTQICLGLKHVHDRKILHRDIKAQNVFLTKTNRCLLGDFGIAKILDHTQGFARTMVGTPYYLSPEIIERKNYSFQSDIWSLGVLLYYLCTLKPPFDATNLHALGAKILKGIYSPIPRHYSKELKGLVTQMLMIDPVKRPLINDILNTHVIQARIKSFLNEAEYSSEFNHTILHKVNVLKNKDGVSAVASQNQPKSKKGSKAQVSKEVEAMREKQLRIAELKKIEELKAERKRIEELQREQEKHRKQSEERKEKRRKEILELMQLKVVPIAKTPRAQVANFLVPDNEKGIVKPKKSARQVVKDKQEKIPKTNYEEYYSERVQMNEQKRKERNEEFKKLKEDIKQQRMKKEVKKHGVDWLCKPIPRQITPVELKKEDVDAPNMKEEDKGKAQKEVDSYILMCQEMEKLVDDKETPIEQNVALEKLEEENPEKDKNRDDMHEIKEEKIETPKDNFNNVEATIISKPTKDDKAIIQKYLEEIFGKEVVEVVVDCVNRQVLYKLTIEHKL